MPHFFVLNLQHFSSVSRWFVKSQRAWHAHYLTPNLSIIKMYKSTSQITRNFLCISNGITYKKYRQESSTRNIVALFQTVSLYHKKYWRIENEIKEHLIRYVKRQVMKIYNPVL